MTNHLDKRLTDRPPFWSSHPPSPSLLLKSRQSKEAVHSGIIGSDQLLIHVFFTRGSDLESSKQYLRINCNVAGKFALLVSWSNSHSSLSVRWARETTMKIIWKTKLKSYVQSPTKIVLQTTPKVYKSTLCRIRAYVVQLAKEGRYSSHFGCIY